MPVAFIFNQEYADYAVSVMRHGNQKPDPFKTYIILTNQLNLGVSFTSATTYSTTKALLDIIAAELPEKNGYRRIPYRAGNGKAIASYDTTNHLFKTEGTHDYVNGQKVVFFALDSDGTMPATTPQVKAGTPYFVNSPDPVNGSFKVSLALNGPSLTIESGGTKCCVSKFGGWNATNNRHEGPTDVMLVTAGADVGGINFDYAIILLNTTSWGCRQITSVNIAEDKFFTSISADIQNGQEVFFTADAGATLPTLSTGTLANKAVYKIMGVADSGKEFQITLDGTNPIGISTAGSGTFYVRSAVGLWEVAIREDTAVATSNIPANRTRQFTHSSVYRFV